MAALWNGSKCSHTTCMLRFFTAPRLDVNPNLIFEIGSSNHYIHSLMVTEA
jgi:hypothetical protein